MTDASTLATISEAPSYESKIRSTKRKLDDAFQVLDSAVTAGSTVSDRPSPPKRTNTIRSLYSTLAKYGIKSGTPRTASTSTVPNVKSTPHLTAILTRAALRTKNTFSFKFPSQSQSAPLLPATAEYRPSSLPSFLSRLATYKLTTYANKPPSIDAVAASKCGWINDGKDRLVCGLCNASWVVAGREGMNRDAANALIEKQRVSLVEAHKNGCPWKTRQCEDSIYCIPLQSPAAMIKDIKSKAIAMDPVIKDIMTKHPLTTSQLNALRTTVASHTQPITAFSPTVDEHQPEASTSTTPPEPSETAILACLFGWTLVPPAAPEPLRRSSTTRANSVASSAPPSPTPSRASNILPPPFNTDDQTRNALLQCELCQRRIGLWAFSARSPANESTDTLTTEENGSVEIPSTPAAASRPKKALPRRSFDLLKEHRSYCPYVVKQFEWPHVGPSLSHFNGKNGTPGMLEGWRAVLTVILRYGMAQKQRIEYNFLAPKDSAMEEDESDKMEVDNVKAMVTGVKTRGGKDLLKYVRGLLG
ncbi:C3HC zinc finger-like-domain-containing protein [Flammula alnicola]|nr:C3HC zinc finger-like-domain-containing protein [Flammula alnicola]